MADNYLERQREQYEARKAAWEYCPMWLVI